MINKISSQVGGERNSFFKEFKGQFLQTLAIYKSKQNK